MADKKHLHILWTNADLHTTQYMLMMYATNCLLKGWWDEVTVIVWGATAKLLAENREVQEKMALAVDAGVKFSACVTCARQLGVMEDLEKLGVEIIPWGDPLTRLLQGGSPLLTV